MSNLLVQLALKRKEALNQLKEKNRVQAPSLASLLFPEQLAFIEDPARFKVARCSRRAGKTTAVAHYMRKTASSGVKFNCLYLAKTRDIAKRLMWNDLKKLCILYKDNVKINEADLSIYFHDTDAYIYLKGVPDAKGAEKLRGDKFKLIVIDEAQGFPTYAKYLVEEVLRPSLFDLQGTLALTGTPNESCAGFFYDADNSSVWKSHTWTFRDNSYLIDLALANNKALRSVDDLIAQELIESGRKIDDPSIQREYFGRWVASSSLNIYSYDPSLNQPDQALDLDSPDLRVVLGIDTGFNDADAIVAVGFTPRSRNCYLLEEFKMPKQDITDLANKILYFRNKYNPYKIVMDQGALGKKIGEELNNRHSLNIEAAIKTEKFSYIKLLNADLSRGFIKIPKDSQLALEMRQLKFDEKLYKENKYKESDQFENHLCDAFLYAWRDVYTHFFKQKTEAPKIGTPEWYKQEEDRMYKHAIESTNRNNQSDHLFSNNNQLFSNSHTRQNF